MRLDGKTAIVTGGSSGIGRVMAREFARAGAAVLLADIDEAGGAEAVRDVEEAGGRATFQRTDVTSADDVQAMVEQTLCAFGRLDLAFNGAGIEGQQRPLPQQDDAEAQRTFRIMIDGLFHCLKHEILAMLDTGGGAIVNVSGTMGLNAIPEWSPYVAAKHAVSGLTKTAALEFAQRGIRVNAVAPGPILTPMLERCTGGKPHTFAESIPMGRVGRPEEVTRAALWLLSEEASYVTGHILAVDGGVSARV